MRTLHLTNPQMHGSDVKTAQNLLIKNGYLATGENDGVFGLKTAIACERGKYYLGYAKVDIKPTYGDQINGYLKGTTSIPASYKIMAERRKGISFVEFEQLALRQKIVTIAQWGVRNAHDIHYEQRRPIDGINHPYQLPLYTDCSGFVTLCYHWAKAPDPNGRSYDGLGYTGTILQHMKPIQKNMIKIGDLVVFGNFPGHHVAIIVGVATSSNPALTSLGNENGPANISYTNEQAGQPYPAHWLTLPDWGIPYLY